jgi:hypothetical protein
VAWVKLENSMPEHPKVLAAGPLAAWLHVCGLAYCDRNLTDGFISDRVLPRLADISKPKACANALVTAGLWREVEGGYAIHDYLTHQRSKAQVEAEKQAAVERARRYRERHRNGVTEASRHAVSHGARENREERYTPPAPQGEAQVVPLHGKTDVHSLLCSVAERKQVGKPSATAVAKAITEFSDRDHLAVAKDLEYWALHGNGAKRQSMAIANTYRNFLKRADATVKATKVGGGVLSTRTTCKPCGKTITNLQANNQSGLCDPCYEAHMERMGAA